MVDNDSGEYIGQVEPRLASRLLNFMEGGNRYEGAITSARRHEVTVILREVYQHPSQMGRVSFPSKNADGFRSDVRQSIIKYDLDREDIYQELDAEREAWEETEEEEMPEGITIMEGGNQALKVGDEDESVP